MTTYIGYTGNEDKFLSAEDRGIAIDIVGGVQQLRPMTVEELAARDARRGEPTNV